MFLRLVVDYFPRRSIEMRNQTPKIKAITKPNKSSHCTRLPFEKSGVNMAIPMMIAEIMILIDKRVVERSA